MGGLAFGCQTSYQILTLKGTCEPPPKTSLVFNRRKREDQCKVGALRRRRVSPSCRRNGIALYNNLKSFMTALQPRIGRRSSNLSYNL